MKKIALFVLFASVVFLLNPSSSFAKYNWDSTSYEQDAYGRWERSDTTYSDFDGDGVVNKYDSNNRNPYKW